jgi:hypothetical protein
MRNQELKAHHKSRDGISMEHKEVNKIKRDNSLLGCDSMQSVSSVTSVLKELVNSIFCTQFSCSEDGGRKFLQNTGIYIPNYNLSQPKRQQPLQEQITRRMGRP